MAYEERTYQQEAIAGCVAALLENGRESVLLESPVGSGKTYMALEAIHRFQSRLGRRLKVNWVAPRHRLLQQMQEANKSLYKDDIRPVSLFDHRPPTADFVVLDEAHHEATQSCVLLYEKMKPTWTMGLSATPLRTDRMKLSFQETIRTCSIGRLIREGFLSPFNSYLIPEYNVATVAEHYLADVKRWGKSLVFFSTIAECLEFRALLAVKGIPCEVVTGESDKNRQMDLFERGLVPVIANVSMLTEGFDQPDVQSVFARDGTRLPIIQMCGRGLRKAPGKTACNIVQSANSSYLFERVTTPKNAYRFQKNRWLALKDGTEEIESTLTETLRRLELLQKKDRKARKDDYKRAENESPGRFARAIERMAKVEEREKSYYSRHGHYYETIQTFLQRLNEQCHGGGLPACILHFDKGTDSTRGISHVEEKFVQKADAVRPAIVLTLANCLRVTARRLGVALMESFVKYARLCSGLPPFSDVELEAELDRLGYLARRKAYRRDSPMAEIMRAADEILAFVPNGLRSAMFDSFKGTKKGDVKFFDNPPSNH